MRTAVSIARAGGAVGRVGVPQEATIPLNQPAVADIGQRGLPAQVTERMTLTREAEQLDQQDEGAPGRFRRKRKPYGNTTIRALPSEIRIAPMYSWPRIAGG
jgi:hypothetical protein